MFPGFGDILRNFLEYTRKSRLIDKIWTTDWDFMLILRWPFQPYMWKITGDRRTFQDWKFQGSSSPYVMDFQFEMQSASSKISRILRPWQGWHFTRCVTEGCFEKFASFGLWCPVHRWESRPATINLGSGLDKNHMEFCQLGPVNKPDDSKLPCTTQIDLNG